MRGSHAKKTPTWPFLLVLVCLFVLSLTAPRNWEKIARRKPLVTSAGFARHATRGRHAPTPAVDPRDLSLESNESSIDPDGSSSPTLPETGSRAAPRARFSHRAARPGDLGPAIANFAPHPGILGSNGQISVRIPSDSPPLVVMRPDSHRRPAVIDQPVDEESTVPLAQSEPTAEEPSEDTTDVAPQPQDLETPAAIADYPASDVDPVIPGFSWAEPEQLMARLEALSYREGLTAWSFQVIGLLHELMGSAGPHAPEAADILAQLEAAADSVSTIAANLNGTDSAELQRTAYALRRRLAVWSPWVSLPQGDTAELAIAVPQPDRLALCLSEVEAATSRDAAGRGWRDYLLFDALQGLADGRGGSEANSTRLLAQRVLARLTAARLSKSQRRFVADETLARLAGELRSWAAEPIAAEQVFAHVEAYEKSGTSADARILAADLDRLAWSPVVELQEYGKQLEQTYRNANIRVVVSEEILTRMMPPQKPHDEAVRLTILGTPTRGRSHTESDVLAQLIPDPRRLRFRVEVHGQVTARTTSQSGPATMYSQSRSSFEASREMEMTLAGLQAREMVASAESSARLRDVETSFDGIPLVGSLVGNYARQQYSQQRPTAERELERIVAQKAIDNIADQSASRVVEVNRQLNEHLTQPLERLGIEPALIETHTSDDRLTARVRIAGKEQLGAHSPRPRAPSTSLLSAQIHESAVNNFLDRLNLGGRKVSQSELYEELVDTLGLPRHMIPPNIRDDVVLLMAADDPVRVRFQEGRITIELKLVELRAEGHVWRNFAVRAYYRPDPASPAGELMRDGTVELIGRSLRPKSQVALRGIFSSTFSKDRRLAVIPEKLANDPRMEGIRVTQWALADGWIGLALGDVRPGHSPVAAAPETGKTTK